jgi:hypothetical protein
LNVGDSVRCRWSSKVERVTRQVRVYRASCTRCIGLNAHTVQDEVAPRVARRDRSPCPLAALVDRIRASRAEGRRAHSKKILGSSRFRGGATFSPSSFVRESAGIGRARAVSLISHGGSSEAMNRGWSPVYQQRSVSRSRGGARVSRDSAGARLHCAREISAVLLGDGLASSVVLAIRHRASCSASSLRWWIHGG